MGMTATATVTLPDGRTATISGPDKDAVRRRVAELRQREASNEIASMPSLDDAKSPDWKPGFQGGDGQSLLRDAGSAAKDVGLDALAVADVGMTLATGAVGEMVAGVAGAINMLPGFGGDIDSTVTNMRAVSDFITIEPKTKRGKELLEDVAVPLMEFERAVDKFSEVAGRGNPFASALIKTTLLGGLELAAPAKRATATWKAHKEIAKQRKALVAEAEVLGIDLEPRNIQATTIDAIRRMTPEERAANSSIIQEALIKAADDHKASVKNLFDDAEKKRALIEKSSVQDFGSNLRQRLDDRGWDLSPGAEKMSRVRKTIEELEGFGSDIDAGGANVRSVNLNKLERIRRRVNKRYGTDPSANAALTEIKHSIDGFLDEQFMKDAISGDPTSIKAWKDARAANKLWHKNFSENKVIADLISKEATPETVSQWLIGASSMRAKSEAASVVNRIKRVLGDDHPAVEGIRQDFLWGVAEPVLREMPNFKAFVKNYETAVQKNPSLIKALDLDNSSMEHLYRVAKAQSELPAATIKSLDLHRVIAGWFVGHGIHRGGIKMKVMEGLTRLATGADKITKKQLIADLTGAIYDQPVIPKQSVLAAEFIAGASITSIDEEDK